MKTAIDLRREIANHTDEMRRLIDRAEHAKRAMTPDENQRYYQLDGEIDVIKEQINMLEKQEKRDGELAEQRKKIVNPMPHHMRPGGDYSSRGDSDEDFRNIGEYFFDIYDHKKNQRISPRLQRCRDIQEERDQFMGTGATGGFAVPTQFDSVVRQVTPQEAIVRPRATVIPAGSPPDAELSFPALDQSSSSNIYGGVEVTHTGEGVTMTETGFKLKEITMQPKEMSAYMIVSQKLINNWEASTSYISNQLRTAMIGAEDFDMTRGSGVNRCLGFYNSPAVISVPRTTANQIAYADVTSMLSRMKMGGNPVWLASQTVIPQLAAMVDAGSHAVWTGGGNLPGVAGPLPSSLFGYPLLFVDKLPALGTKGDLALVDLSYYLIKDGSGPSVASSEHILFLSNKVVFKIVWNVDGRPWLNEPLQLEGSTSTTVSPFVLLN